MPACWRWSIGCASGRHGRWEAVPAVMSCYEAGYDGFWLHRLLMAAGITNYVFDPASIAVDQRARRVKTDRIDGEKMLRTLMAYLRGEPRVVRIVRVPTPEQEDARRASRERGRLTKEQTAHTNRIKALLRLLGMAVGNPRRRDWLSWLAAQRDWQGQAVPPQMHGRDQARARTADAGARAARGARAGTSAQADPTPAAAQMAQRSELLLRLKSLGPAFATTLTNEVFYKDFRNRREVASYFGLAPSPWQSGGIDRDQGISKAGNPRARCAAIETGLAVAAASAGQRAHPIVSAAHAQCQQAHQAHRHRGVGAQADRGALALSHNRPGARGSDAQGRRDVNASTNASASRHLPRSARDG